MATEVHRGEIGKYDFYTFFRIGAFYDSHFRPEEVNSKIDYVENITQSPITI